jgi:DNA-binding XRE family transcriptional regulator
MSREAFRAIRRRLGIKQKIVGQSVGLSAASVCKYEKGTWDAPHPERMRPAAEKLLETWKMWEGEA